jgi:CheY-like chemotaxis protein
MDGLQAARQIRKWEKEQIQAQAPQEQLRTGGSSSEDAQPLLEPHSQNSVLPLRIIALTADVMPGVSEECDAAGMDGFLTKPLDYRNLLRVVQEVCEGQPNA